MKYKIIRDDVPSCEDRLNKWSKEYNLNIIQMCVIREIVIILMTVEKKRQYPGTIMAAF